MKFNNSHLIQTKTVVRLFMFGLVLWQQTARADDLMAVYQNAKQHDSVYAAAQSTRAAEQEKDSQASALLKPSVTLTAASAYNTTDTQYQGSTVFPGGKQDFNSNSYGITLIQPLYNKQDWEQLDQTQLQLKQADAKLKHAEQDLILRVAQAYFDLLAAQDNLLFYGAQKQAIEKQLQQAKRKFDVGSSTITDVYETQARYDLVLANEMAASNAVLVKRRNLAKITGVAPPQLALLSSRWQPSAPDPLDESQWLAMTGQSNLNVVIQSAAYKIAEQEIERQGAGYYPTLDLVASYREESANGSASFGSGVDSSTGSIGVQLSMPLYSGGGTSSRKREAVQMKEVSRHLLEEAERNAQLDTSQAYLGVMNGVAQVSALIQAVASNGNLLQSSQRSWELGSGTTVDVLNAQQQLYSAKRDLQQARYNTIMSELSLSASVGQLTEADLKKVNDFLVEP